MGDKEIGLWYSTRHHNVDIDQVAGLIEKLVEKLVDERMNYIHIAELDYDDTPWSKEEKNRCLKIALWEFNIPKEDWPFVRENKL